MNASYVILQRVFFSSRKTCQNLLAKVSVFSLYLTLSINVNAVIQKETAVTIWALFQVKVWCCVVLQQDTNVHLANRGSNVLWNICILPQQYMSQPRRPWQSSLPWKPHIYTEFCWLLCFLRPVCVHYCPAVF